MKWHHIKNSLFFFFFFFFSLLPIIPGIGKSRKATMILWSNNTYLLQILIYLAFQTGHETTELFLSWVSRQKQYLLRYFKKADYPKEWRREHWRKEGTLERTPKRARTWPHTVTCQKASVFLTHIYHPIISKEAPNRCWAGAKLLWSTFLPVCMILGIFFTKRKVTSFSFCL